MRHATIYPTEQCIQGEDATLRIKVPPSPLSVPNGRDHDRQYLCQGRPLGWMLPFLAPQSTDYYPSLHELGPEPS
jgi:hypothetical protein